MKEPHAKQPFGILNQFGERRRGDAELVCGAREVELPGDTDEGMYMTEFELSHVSLSCK
jgi:hypothetical protein